MKNDQKLESPEVDAATNEIVGSCIRRYRLALEEAFKMTKTLGSMGIDRPWITITEKLDDDNARYTSSGLSIVDLWIADGKEHEPIDIKIRFRLEIR